MPNVDKEVLVTVARDPNGTPGTNVGYGISVLPWLVKPEAPAPPADDEESKELDKLTKITWKFETPPADNLQFGDITLNFKTKNHFVPPPQKKGVDYVLRNNAPPAPSKTIIGEFSPTFDFVSKNYNYIIEFILIDDEEGKVLEMELDPGYRVYP